MNHKQTGPAARPILESTARVLLLAVAVLALPPQSTAQQAQLAPKPIPVPNLGVWEDPVAWPIVAVHMLHHPNGKMLIWAYDGPSAHVWDPKADPGVAFTPVPNLATNIFCSGHAALAKGQFVTAGGIFVNSTQIFDYTAETWATKQNMAFNRFYPTCTTLPDGRVLTVSGSAPGPVLIPEVYDAGLDTWTQLPNASMSLPLFPFMFLLPSGDVFFGGPSTGSYTLDVAAEQWTFVDNSANDGASAVMLHPGVVLKAGGTSSANKVTEVIDLNADNPAWKTVGPMAFDRHHPDVVLLPDGTALVVGGHGQGNVEVLEAELYNPETEKWTTLAAMETPRKYHSTAMLLQDARVIVAGGDGYPSGEIFNPPYLYKGPRPKIGWAPDAIPYNENFKIEVSSEVKVAGASLLRLGGVTHSFDQNQRYIPIKFEYQNALAVAASPAVLVAHSPGNANIAPPGAYLLFLLSNKGVPSVGHYILIH